MNWLDLFLLHFLFAHTKNNLFVFICENSTRQRAKEDQVPLSVVLRVPARLPVSTSEGDSQKTEHFLWGRGLCWSLCWVQARCALGKPAGLLGQSSHSTFPSQAVPREKGLRAEGKRGEVKQREGKPRGSGVGPDGGCSVFCCWPWAEAWKRLNNLRKHSPAARLLCSGAL